MDFNAITLESLGIEAMASGHLCLNLSQNVSWQDFPVYANALLKILGGSKVNVAESVEMRVWEVSFGGRGVRLVYDDYPAMVSIESRDEEGDITLRDLFARLVRCSNGTMGSSEK